MHDDLPESGILPLAGDGELEDLHGLFQPKSFYSAFYNSDNLLVFWIVYVDTFNRMCANIACV